MDWLQKFYFKLWNKFGGRPFTEIWRDSWVKYELLHQVIWFFTGVGVFYYMGWKGLGVWLGAYIYGYCQGHFCWQDRFLYKKVDDEQD